MTAASVFLIYRDHEDKEIEEIKKGLEDYKGYDSALGNCQIEVIPWRNMQTFKEIYNWVVPHLRHLKHFANRAFVWVFPPDMQDDFDKFVSAAAQKAGVSANYKGYKGIADIPKGCVFVLGTQALVYLIDRIEHELTHVIWGLNWHDVFGNLLDKVKLYPDREKYLWVETGRAVTIEGRAYSW